MDKLMQQDGKSLDIMNENLKALKAILHEAFTEGDGGEEGCCQMSLRNMELLCDYWKGELRRKC